MVKNQDGREVFEWFEKYVLHAKLVLSINHLELVNENKLLCISDAPVHNSILTS